VSATAGEVQLKFRLAVCPSDAAPASAPTRGILCAADSGRTTSYNPLGPPARKRVLDETRCVCRHTDERW